MKKNTRNIQSLKDKVIVFDGFEDGEIYVISVDGVNYGTNEFRLTPDTKFYNHKKNDCGVKYEYGLALRRVSMLCLNWLPRCKPNFAVSNASLVSTCLDEWPNTSWRKG